MDKLSDEEVWLRVYCAALSNSNVSKYDAQVYADYGLKEFKYFQEHKDDDK